MLKVAWTGPIRSEAEGRQFKSFVAQNGPLDRFARLAADRASPRNQEYKTPLLSGVFCVLGWFGEVRGE